VHQFGPTFTSTIHQNYHQTGTKRGITGQCVRFVCSPWCGISFPGTLYECVVHSSQNQASRFDNVLFPDRAKMAKMTSHLSPILVSVYLVSLACCNGDDFHLDRITVLTDRLARDLGMKEVPKRSEVSGQFCEWSTSFGDKLRNSRNAARALYKGRIRTVYVKETQSGGDKQLIYSNLTSWPSL
jgi:hypothetical protein